MCLQCRRSGFHPWVRKIPWRRKWLPTPVCLPWEFHGQRSLVGYSPWRLKQHDSVTNKHGVKMLNITNTKQINNLNTIKFNILFIWPESDVWQMVFLLSCYIVSIKSIQLKQCIKRRSISGVAQKEDSVRTQRDLGGKQLQFIFIKHSLLCCLSNYFKILH